MKRVRDVRDDADQILIDKHGLSRDIMGDLPQKVGDIRDWILLALEDEPEPLDEPTDEDEALEGIENAMDGNEPNDAYPAAA
jgi:hypothetical protein